MRKVIIVSLLLIATNLVFADPPINETYSYQSFPAHKLSFKEVPAEAFNNTIIRNSCFYQEWVEGDIDVVKDIFPDEMTGVTFVGCNLDNVLVPVGNTIIGGTNKKIKVQNDWDDWFLDESLNPIEPLNKDRRLDSSLSIDPNDIPAEKWTLEERKAFKEELNNANINP